MSCSTDNASSPSLSNSKPNKTSSTGSAGVSSNKKQQRERERVYSKKGEGIGYVSLACFLGAALTLTTLGFFDRQRIRMYNSGVVGGCVLFVC